MVNNARGQDLLSSYDPEQRAGAARALGARAPHRGSFLHLLERLPFEADPRVLAELTRALLRHFSITTADEMMGRLWLARRDTIGECQGAIRRLLEELGGAMSIPPEEFEQAARRSGERWESAPDVSASGAPAPAAPELPARAGATLPDDGVVYARALLARGDRVQAVAVLQAAVRRGDGRATLAAAWLGAILSANGQGPLAQEYLARVAAAPALAAVDLEPVRIYCRERGLSPLPRELRTRRSAGGSSASDAFGRSEETTLQPEQAALYLPGRFIRIVLIGSGGMGIVYRAHDTELDQTLAIKMLAPSHWKDARAVKRFALEARALARLSHPAVLRVLSIERAEVPYFTMELLEGRTLDALLEGDPPEAGVVLGHLLPILEALDHCHEAGLIHRDIKPRNIFVTHSGGVRLMDFGVVKSAGASSVTKAGAVVGTPHYMAPEQLIASRVDRRADIFAFGVTLFQMLTGELPFQDPIEVFSRRTPSIRDWIDLPEALDRIVQRCLARSPSDRFPDCRELAAALRPFAAGTPHAPIAPSSRDVFSAVLLDCLERGAMGEREHELLAAVRRLLGISADVHRQIFRDIRSRVKGERNGSPPMCMPPETLFRMVARRHLKEEARDPESERLLEDVGRLLEIPRPRRRELERAAADES